MLFCNFLFGISNISWKSLPIVFQCLPQFLTAALLCACPMLGQLGNLQYFTITNKCNKLLSVFTF